MAHAELTEDQAFNFQAQLNKRDRLELSWQIAPNHFIYKEQILVINNANKPLIKTRDLPKGILVQDPTLGEYEVYGDSLEIFVPINSKSDVVLVRYQGCSKEGFCYLPISKLIKIDNNDLTIEDSFLTEFPTENVADKFSTMIQDRFLPLTLLIFFGLGILLSFTPCVLPMIPLVVNLIIGPKSISSRKAFLLASSYVLGMAVCYTTAGIVAGLLGATLQAWLQQPVVLIGLCILLVILALNQFELIHVSLPHFNKRLHHWGQRQLQGSIVGAFILGVLASLIVSPCITPPLIGVLTYISQNGNPLIGGLILLCLSLGMGIPLIFVAMLSSMILPKAGQWMNVVKSAAGVALLGLAIWLLQRIIPPYVGMMLWGGLCIITAMLLNAFEPLKHPKRSTRILKGIGIIFAIYGASLFVTAIYQQFAHKTSVEQKVLDWHNIDTLNQLEKELAIAQQQDRNTLLEFYAYWCTSCRRMESTVFGNKEIIEKLKDFNLLRVDMTDMNEKQKDLLAKLNIYAPPVTIFFDKNGQELTAKRVGGEISADDMLEILNSIP